MRSDEHHKIQAGIVKWARDLQHMIPRLKWLYAIPNGGLRDKRTAAKLKAEGVMAGVLDLCLPVPHLLAMNDDWPPWGQILYCGLYVEVKLPSERNHKDGGLSPDQVAFRNFIIAQGYAAEIAYTTMEGIEIIRNHLGME